MKFAIGILALLVVLGIRQAITDTYVETVATVSAGGPAKCLEVRGSTTLEEDGKTYIIGNLRNNCGRSVGQSTVVFSLEPDSASRTGGRAGGTLYAYVRDLKSGETRRFKTMFPIPKNRPFHFESINAF
jgi:hypothetical protein